MFSFGIRNVRIPLKKAGSPSPRNSNDPQGETSGFLKPVFLLRLVFDHIAELIHKKAGLPHIPKTKQERIAEDTLRQELLVDWVELFTAGPAS